MGGHSWHIHIHPTSLGGGRAYVTRLVGLAPLRPAHPAGPENNGRRYPQHALIHLSFRVKIWVELACWITQSQIIELLCGLKNGIGHYTTGF
ncbi:PiggyBac transposable elementderived protein 3like [Caligus rogercresseyi]|uniref:PiggyBac transposable elementderived protein 3like n=1 Tax=Caligus rogercresseyi TaxID=217165 RepID=A0A7T8HKC0_CALRO|nr:PiggyBac transposable elementderived protein 3like [Caligus rogercresseyi]